MYKAVLLDDEIWALNNLCQLLDWQECGFEISAKFTDADEAYRFICEYPTDVLFTDIEMSGTNGLELIKRLRDINKDLVIVIVSAYDNFEYARTAIKYNVKEYMLKPVKRENLEEVLLQISNNLAEKRKKSDNEREIKIQSEPAVDKIQSEHIKDIEHHKLRKIVEYIDEHYREKLLLSDVAARHKISPSRCSTLFAQQLNCSFPEYVSNLKLKKAKELVEESSMNLYEIAEYIGYEYFYFIKQFSKRYGLTPAQYRKKRDKKEE